MTSHRSPLSKRRVHSAFTLLETVIAMSLLSLLLVVLWSIFGTFTKYDTKGKRAAAKSALVRAVHRQLREDLIAAVGVNHQLPRSFSIDPADQIGQDTPWQPRNGYFVGTASAIHFVAHVAPDGEKRKSDSSDYISITSTNPPTELFRVISYEARLPTEDAAFAGGTIAASEPDIADISFLDGLSEPIDETPLGIDRHVRNWQQYIDSRPLVSEEVSSTFAGRDIQLGQDDFLVIWRDGRQHAVGIRRSNTPRTNGRRDPRDSRDVLPIFRRHNVVVHMG